MDEKSGRAPAARVQEGADERDRLRPGPEREGGDRGTDGDKFRLEAPSISLPKGGGAIKGIDETFSVNPSNGTATLSLPLPFSPGRNGVTPPVRIGYDSGSGNGILGLGWSLDLPSIRRRTDRKVPRYRDEEDVFLLSGAEDLVPALRWDADHWEADADEIGLYSIRRYRPRTEGSFARIERISHPLHGTWWRVTSRDDLTTFYGLDEESRIVDPSDSNRIYQWLPALTFDNLGNCLVYEHKKEDQAGVPVSLAERNRRLGLAPFANRYLKRIRYGNRVPCFAADADPYRPAAPAGAFVFEAVFDYGEHDAASPTPGEVQGQDWGVRADSFSSYRSGFEIRTWRLLRRVLMFHRFDELAGGQPCLVRSLDLGYASSSDGSPQQSQVTYLRSATQHGYHLLPGGGYSRKSLPPIELEYEPLHWDDTVRTVDPESAANLPAGPEAGAAASWLDLFGEGIAGVFTEQASAWFYKANLGDVDEDGRVRLDRQRLVLPRPSFAGMVTGVLRLEELEADGARQIVVESPELSGYFELGETGDWLPFRPFEGVLRIDLNDRNLRRLDLDGDGRADILISEEQAFVWYPSDGRRGHQPMQRAAKPRDEERGAAIVFADATQSILLADMSGDGLSDIVRIRNGEVSYWPNLGYGRFGARVAMDNAPWFDHPDRYNPDYLHLADVSGTGVTDLLYLGDGGRKAYLNLNGNAWSDAQPIASFFPSEKPNQIGVTDLLGNGTACIVWSSGLPAHAEAPMRYIDLMGGRKPHLLRKYVNNLGKEVTFSYKSSTWYYLKDKLEGRPWITRLPFPVHCLRRVEVRDRVGGSRMVSEYRYHHGYYDRPEREFRGFGMVEQTDTEQFEHWVKGSATNVVDRALHQPPVLTRTWFHTGAFLDRERILTLFREEHWDREMARQGFAVTADEPGLSDARIVAAPGIDPAALDKLTPEESRQALRACKGMVLRTEVFALDAPAAGATSAEVQRQLSPYTVSTHNCLIELLQPALGGAPAVFVAKESEAITWHYDRELADPRVEHTLNVRVDPYGNVLESASVAYGRKTQDPALPDGVRAEQARTWITYRKNEMTNDAVGPAHHRLRRPSQVSAYEIRGLPRSGPLYHVSDFVDAGAPFDVLADSVEIPYHQKTVDPPPGTVFRRLLHRKQTLFYDDDAAAALPLHTLGFRALSFESYQLAYTPELLADVFAGRATDPMLVEGKYVHRGDASWWIRSGRHEYLAAGETVADARSRFFTPIAHVDGHGARTVIRQFSGYFLLVQETEDAALNRNRVTDFDLRVLLPRRMLDANDNVVEVLLDELGLVKASARLGKGGEGDDLSGLTAWSTPAEDAATVAFFAAASSTALTAQGQALALGAAMRHLYDVHRYKASGGTLPPVVATVSRERHAAVSAASSVQITFEYSNGLGAVAMAKTQAEPGLARQAVVQPGDTVVIQEVDTRTLVPVQLRWLGTGRKVLNNKGKTVKEYEPYFSVTHQYESYPELVETGVTAVRFYDPADRIVRMDHPGGTFLRKDHASWKAATWDRNDTVLQSAWYDRRINRLIDAELIAAGKDPVREAEAAAATAQHAGTPRTAHFNALGHPILEEEHNGLDLAAQPILYRTFSRCDVEGRVLDVTDARNNPAISYKHDLTGRIAYHDSMDGGQRWMLDDIAGQPLRSWDERGHALACSYDDPLHRLTGKRVTGGDGPQPLDHVFERRIYGEGVAGDKALNLRGQLAVLYDTSGKAENLSFDFKGHVAGSARRFATDYRKVPDWSGPGPDALLDGESFASSSVYDALDRVSERTAPDGSVYRPGYNEANLLETVQVTQEGATRFYVKNIDYDEKGRRQRIVFGNDVSATYVYDKETFRLLHLSSRKLDGELLQDFHYTYDPIGNLTHLEDRCVPTVWFGNQMVTGLATYRYDPLYRLVEATGREHPGQLAAGAADNWDDAPFLARHGAADPMTWRNYAEAYTYDEAGNLAQMRHTAAAGDWTRDYTYAAGNNRLLSTQVGLTVFPYGHHPDHGYMTSMPHLSLMRWSFRDELQAVATQVVNAGTPETTWYVYDGDGNRVRKVTDRTAAPDADAVKKSERYYLDGVEIYREYGAGGATTTERRTFHVMDDRQRVAMIDRHTIAAGPPDPTLVRYQGPDHLGSARLETDADARVISYEEYHPFGTTAYQAVDKDVIAAARRYRYTEMERDEESGLEHHGARYYVPWLGRWTAPDKHPDQLTGNRYAYSGNNPVIHTDTNGMFEEPVHGATTYRLAVAAGFKPADAFRIALADANMDHDPEYDTGGDDPIRSIETIQSGSAERYHFAPMGTVSARIESQISELRRPDPGSLTRFGRDLHTLQDVGTRTAPGPHSLGTKVLAADLIAGGVLALGLGIGSTVGAAEALAQSSKGAGYGILGVVLIVLAVALISAAFAAWGVASKAGNVGHGAYVTQAGEQSDWKGPNAHVTDQAYQNPDAYRARLWEDFAVLQRAARAYYGPNARLTTDPDEARQAIEDVVHADTSFRISGVLNAPVAGGPSWAKQLERRAASGAPGAWLPREANVTDFSEATQRRTGVRGERFVYDPNARWRWGNP